MEEKPSVNLKRLTQSIKQKGKPSPTYVGKSEWPVILTNLGTTFAILGVMVSFFLWLRTEANSDRRELLSIIESNRRELCAIIDSNKKELQTTIQSSIAHAHDHTTRLHQNLEDRVCFLESSHHDRKVR